MASVLVTGATGFTGSHLTRRLIEEEHEVRVLVRPNSNYSGLEIAGAEPIIGDITDKASVRKAASGVEVVYHIAALYRIAGLPDSTYWDVNYHGTANLLEAVLDYGVRKFVHCSTIGVHSSVSNPPADETAPYEPDDVYQTSKCEAEKLALKFHEIHGLPVTVIRPAGIYGPEDTRWLKLFRAIARRRFAMLGSGETFIHMVYISDLVDAFKLAAEVPGVDGKVYIAAGERYVTLNELTRIIAGAVNVQPPKLHIPLGPIRIISGVCEDICRTIRVEPPIFRRRVDFFVKNRAFDITRAKKELGYSPKVDLEEGVRLTAEWYREQGLL